MLSISANEADRELALVRALLEARPAAIVVALTPHPRPETLAYLGSTYCVQFLQVHEALAGPRVTVEDSSGARLAIDRLLALGHRRIGFVGPDPADSLGEARLRGMNRALAIAGHELEPEYIQLGPSSAAFGRDAVAGLLAMPKPPTAIYLSTAPLSVGGVRAIGERRVRIPEEVSVIVAGSAAWYDVWPKGLTSITLPMARLADAASSLVDGAGRKNMDASRVSLAFELIERGSTAPPAA